MLIASDHLALQPSLHFAILKLISRWNNGTFHSLFLLHIPTTCLKGKCVWYRHKGFLKHVKLDRFQNRVIHVSCERRR